MTKKFLIIERESNMVTVWLNRPEVHNAFHSGVLEELIQTLEELASDVGTRVLVLRGKGKSFCAGADISWMKDAAKLSYEENFDDSLLLSKCLRAIYEFPKPTIAVVHGACYGGGNGFAGACDFVIAHDHATFALSEVKIGLIPACISPYIIKRVGEFQAKSMMLRGNKFGAKEAVRIHLVNYRGSYDQNDNDLHDLVAELLTSGPNALRRTKDLINRVVNHYSFEVAGAKTAEWIAKTRDSEEAQEGMIAFLDKRRPNWID
ncbi:enoyl-CoA hydratase-related protein [Reichenbachiella versicolor]|uniref:enoyl-CoA hydratase-related protein n=1 Tax=Reichenbachiella versicolor TaxID=1821036 RepID=UPI000D6EA392|nr:enoyl-CoA hydratase-related protein [Reichenbachiella versicolor]